MSHIKGGKMVARQNFSMHPRLMRAIKETANQLCVGRSRVTYSKIVGAFVFDALRRGLIEAASGKFTPTEAMAALVGDFETSGYAVASPAFQNFSLHPDLMQAIFDAATALSAQRVELVLEDRSRRVTFSKLVATLVYDATRSGLIEKRGEKFKPTAKMAALVREFEVSPYERIEPAAEKRAFIAACGDYELRREHFRKPFLWEGKRVSVVGFDAGNAKEPLVVEDEESGRRFALSRADFADAPWAPTEKKNLPKGGDKPGREARA